jgi:two-component system response regulator LytT
LKINNKNMSIKVGIVEDEMIIADNIESVLTQLGYATAGPVINYTKALEMVTREQPDIVLIDIMLSGKKDGIDLAWKIKEDFNLPIIFLTANADAATIERAKRLNPSAYLIKPFSKEDLYSAIEICLFNFTPRTHAVEKKENVQINDSLFIKTGQRFNKVKLADILYIETNNVYLNIYTEKQKLVVRKNLQEYLKIIGSPEFIRVHKTYAINLAHVDSLNSDRVIIKNIEIPIGKVYRDELMNALRIG